MSDKDKYPSYQQGMVAAVSLRAPMRGEIMAISVLSASAKVFNVPDGTTAGQPNWLGKHVRMMGDGGDVYIQFSTGLDANVDSSAAAQEATASGRITLTPSASGNGCWKVPADQWVDIPVGLDCRTFAAIASANCKLRTHPSET